MDKQRNTSPEDAQVFLRVLEGIVDNGCPHSAVKVVLGRLKVSHTYTNTNTGATRSSVLRNKQLLINKSFRLDENRKMEARRLGLQTW